MKDVYVRGAREDASQVAWLEEALEKRGFSCFTVPKCLDPSRRYAEQIREVLETCLAFVVISSNASREDRDVLNEVEHACALGRHVWTFETEPIPMEGGSCLLFGERTQRYAAYRDREQAVEDMAARLRALMAGERR